MVATKLLHLEDFTITQCKSQIIDIQKENDNIILILDQTAFYPQGGGQPYDQGHIHSEKAKFDVTEVRTIDEIVKHIGKMINGQFNIDDTVSCQIDIARRHLHNKIHSAGHVIDLAVQSLKLGWIPGRAYHYPQGAYVEYVGSMEGLDQDKLKKDLENLCNEFIREGRTTTIKFVSKAQIKEFCEFVPDYLSNDKPVRLILFGTFAIPCGGTHVNNITEIGKMSIRKIKLERGNIRVGYDVVK